MVGTKMNLKEEIKNLEVEIMNWDKRKAEVVLQIQALNQNLELINNQKLAITKYSFKNIITCGLFNFFKKKKLNEEIKAIKDKDLNLMLEISDIDDKQSAIKTKIIQKCQEMFKIMPSKFISLYKDMVKLDLQIQALNQNLELINNQKLAITKYSFKNIITCGLFNFFKKKKLNEEISIVNGNFIHLNDKKLAIKTKIIEKYQEIFKIMPSKVISLYKDMVKLDLQIEELINNQKLAVTKYSFKNIITCGLFNFFKKKKLNEEISIVNGNFIHLNDKKSQLKNKIIEEYKNIISFETMNSGSASVSNLVEIIKNNSDYTDNLNKRSISSSI